MRSRDFQIMSALAFTFLVIGFESGGRAIAQDGLKSCEAQFDQQSKKYTWGHGAFDVTGRWRLNHDYPRFASFPLPIISVVRDGEKFRGSFVGFDDPKKPRSFATKWLANQALSLAKNAKLLIINTMLLVAQDRFVLTYQYKKEATIPFIDKGFSGEGICCGILKDKFTISWDFCSDKEAEKYLEEKRLKFRWERMSSKVK